MRIAVIGTGYVGLVSGTCFAEFGHQITCVDMDEAKIARLRQGQSLIYEPGLDELLARQIEGQRIRIFERYLHHLHRFSQPSYLDSTFTALGPALEQASAIVYKEFPWKEMNKALYYQNQLVIKRWLEKYQSTR